jgi:hypothetical protein
VSWAVVPTGELRLFARVYPAIETRADDGGSEIIPNTTVAPVAEILEQPGEGFLLHGAEPPLSELDPGPYASLADLTDAIEATTGEHCATVAVGPPSR